MTWSRRLTTTGRPSLIVGGEGALSRLAGTAGERGQGGARLFVVTDENVAAAWAPRIASLLGGALRPGDTLVLQPGESSKSVAGLEACWEWLVARGCRRSDTVVALGGGVVGDLAGFAAATYQRGVSLWQVPTTLLAQVDSSVGGKTAVNLTAGKNLVGAFYQPDLVVIDPATLFTLPAAEYVAGLGEVVKYGLLEPGLLGLLEQQQAAVARREEGVLSLLVQRCVEYKAAVVEEDELDKARRAVLNLGHTTAHALEVTTGYGTLRHGQAVALGLLVALAVSERLLGLDVAVRPRVRGLLEDFGLPVVFALPPAASLLAAAGKDKKVTAEGMNFVGLRAPGDPVWGLQVPADVLEEALGVIRE